MLLPLTVSIVSKWLIVSPLWVQAWPGAGGGGGGAHMRQAKIILQHLEMFKISPIKLVHQSRKMCITSTYCFQSFVYLVLYTIHVIVPSGVSTHKF